MMKSTTGRHADADALEPMSRPTRPDQSSELVRLDPDDLVHPSIPPEDEQLTGEFHGSAGHPQG